MASSMHERSGEIIDLIDRAGLREELEARIEAQNIEKRRHLIAERTRLRAEREQVVPPLEAAHAEAQEARLLLEQKLLAARQVESYTFQRAYGARCKYGTAQIDADIERHAPKFLQDGYDALQEAMDFLSGTFRFWSHRQRIGWGFANVDTSNVEEIAALRMRCADGQAEIKAMMYDDRLSLDEMRTRCAAIVDECLLLTRPQLKDDPHWLRNEERKARAQRKSA
ncbi:hypothetical protein [Burkholderia stagnalis]|uniref:hypothetical protein n=1 Tax=Burkholderia stagnalis TaxID=1503054 RepID=UPI000F5BB9A9|nr:hypothetical protein [Burkholderia stagnalis]RQP98064.1 hypothetical protein DF164_31700 [Burkholderia stagnalis]RQY68850.1 hypothetical protein DF110_18610 [Burkholderia stagnalis]